MAGKAQKAMEKALLFPAQDAIEKQPNFESAETGRLHYVSRGEHARLGAHTLFLWHVLNSLINEEVACSAELVTRALETSQLPTPKHVVLNMFESMSLGTREWLLTALAMKYCKRCAGERNERSGACALCGSEGP